MPPKTKTKKQSTEARLPHPPVSINLYRNLSLGFGIISALLLVVVGIFTLARAEILLRRGAEAREFDLFFNVGTPAESSDFIDGKVIEMIENKKGLGEVSGEFVSALATGKVTFYNKRAVAQTLIPQTRLLNPDGVLFRLNNRITIPARGQIESQVYADKSGQDSEIGPAVFTIPGLPLDLQKLVYAQSSEAMTSGEKRSGKVAQEDIDRAYARNLQELEEAAKAKLQEKLVQASFANPDYIYKSEVLEQSTNAKLGKEASSFEVEQTAHIVGVVFSRTALLNQVKPSLESLISEDRELLPVSLSDLSATLVRADAKINQARIKVAVKARTRLDRGAPALAKDRFFGLTKEEAGKYLRGTEGVADFKIKMPFYLSRVPQDKSRVEIKLINQ